MHIDVHLDREEVDQVKRNLAPWAVVAALIVSACGQAAPASPQPQATQASQPSAAPTSPAVVKKGGTLNVGITTEPSSLDPTRETALSSALVFEQMYDTLIAFDARLNFVPLLAASWTIANDSQSIAFNLRSDVKFHNGRALKSSDVKYSIDLLRKPGGINAGLYANISDVETPSDGTVVFRLKDPAPYDVLSILAVMPTAIMAKEVVDATGDLKRSDAGTGPFMFGSWQSGSRITLKRAPSYWQANAPAVDELVFKIVPDETSALAALRAGEIDWYQFNDTAVFKQAQSDSRIVATEAPFLAYNYFGMNVKVKPFDDVRVRQAISYAIDRRKVIELALDGRGELTGPIVPAQSVAIPVTQFPSYTPSLDKAKALLKEAGVPDGFETTLELIATDAVMKAAAPVVVDQLSKIGIKAKIVPVESAVWIDHLTKVTYPGLIMGSSGGNPNANLPLFNSFTCKGPWNYSGICVQAYDDLQKQVRVATGDQRAKLLGDAQLKIANEMVPYVYLFVRKQLFAWSPAVKNFTPRPFASKPFWQASLERP